jgi:hypothetical protein
MTTHLPRQPQTKNQELPPLEVSLGCNLNTLLSPPALHSLSFPLTTKDVENLYSVFTYTGEPWKYMRQSTDIVYFT